MKHFMKAGVLAMACLVGGVSTSPAFAAHHKTYADVPMDHWAAKSLKQLAKKHKIKLGYPDGTFKGKRNVTRYEMAALILKVMNKLKGKDLSAGDHHAMKGLKKEFAKEILHRIKNLEDQVDSLQDQMDILDTMSNEGRDKLWHTFQKDLPFKLSGDVAIRHQLITSDLSDFAKATVNTPQTRLTLSLDSRTGKDSIFDYGARLSIGNPRNPGQPWWRLGDYYARVGLGFDRFFVSYRPWEPFSITVGKFHNRFSNSEIFYDFDIQPEGAMQQLKWENIAPWFKRFQLLAGETIINMNQKIGGNVFMLSGKMDADFAFGNWADLDLSGGYHQYFGAEHLLNVSNLAKDAGVSTRLLGNQNRNDAGTNFQIANGFGKLTFHLTPDLPLSASADFLMNLAAASGENQAYQVGVQLGQTRRKGQFSLGYNYKMLQKNSTVSFFVEDQLGGTDVMAHEGFLKVKVWDKTTLFATGQAAKRLGEEAMTYTIRTGIHQAF